MIFSKIKFFGFWGEDMGFVYDSYEATLEKFALKPLTDLKEASFAPLKVSQCLLESACGVESFTLYGSMSM